MGIKPWQKRCGLIAVCMSAVLSVSVVKGADISWDNQTGNIEIFGPIENGDFKDVLEKVLAVEKRPAQIRLNSSGGSIRDAMAIGRLADRLSLSCSAAGRCDSACTIVLTGCPQRSGVGTVGMHRPRFDREAFSALSLTEAEKAYDALLAELRAYMDEMSVPEAVMERMLRTPSNRADRIPAEQFISMIGERRPAFDEWLISRCGSLEQTEERDLEIVRNAERYEAVLRFARENPDAISSGDVNALMELESDYDQKQQFTEGYIEYLKNQQYEIKNCEWEARAERAEREWEALKSNR